MDVFEFIKTPIVIVIAAVGSFFMGLVSSWIAWNKNQMTSEIEFRDDIMESNSVLREEVDKLKGRVDVLETDLHEAIKVLRECEMRFIQARMILMEKHAIDLEELLKESGNAL